MTPLEAFREYLRLSCRLSLAKKQDDSHELTVRLSTAYAMLTPESQKVAFAVGQEFQALEDGAEDGERTIYLEAFREYLRMSVRLSEEVVRNGFGSDGASHIRHYMTPPWYSMCDSSHRVCGLVNEEFNRLETA